MNHLLQGTSLIRHNVVSLQQKLALHNRIIPGGHSTYFLHFCPVTHLLQPVHFKGHKVCRQCSTSCPILREAREESRVECSLSLVITEKTSFAQSSHNICCKEILHMTKLCGEPPAMQVGGNASTGCFSLPTSQVSFHKEYLGSLLFCQPLLLPTLGETGFYIFDSTGNVGHAAWTHFKGVYEATNWHQSLFASQEFAMTVAFAGNGKCPRFQHTQASTTTQPFQICQHTLKAETTQKLGNYCYNYKYLRGAVCDNRCSINLLSLCVK